MDMIERVARVIFNSAVGEKNWENEFYAEERAGCFRAARTAIEAMREPTQEMLERGCIEGTNLTPGGPSERLGRRTAGERMADQWRGMIDASLP